MVRIHAPQPNKDMAFDFQAKASKKENKVVNQHLIPESLLANFSTKGQVYEVLFNGDDSKIYITNIRNSMSERFAYEHKDLKQNTIEDFFSEIEKIIVPKISNIISDIENCKSEESDFRKIKLEIEELLPMLMIFYYRSGALLKEFSSINSEDRIPLLSEKILNRRYLDELANTIRNGYKFAVIESKDDFLLSDQYISTAGLKIKSNFFDISNRHIGLRETIVLIPLSSKYYAVFWHTEQNSFFLREGLINNLDDDQVLQINETIINNSYSKCVAKNKNSIESVIDQYSMAYPSQAYLGYESGFTAGVIRKKEVFFYKIDREAYQMLSMMRFWDYKQVGPNDICLCGSRKKFKKCHKEAYHRVEPIIWSMKNDKKNPKVFIIPKIRLVELSIDQWSGYSPELSTSLSKNRKSEI